ncbi:MAG TPA: DsbA family protein [Solirubrobacteraceae bacterium]|nr:DsbA family protein [Solirubrobacteraceae bacterium]
MAGLGSAPPPPVDPASDHVRPAEGGEPLVVLYADFECPYCAALHARLEDLALRVCFRHFPVRSGHPRAWPAALAAEAAACQGRFWEMHDALFADPARLEDPHLWARATALGLDLDRFERDRRSEAVAERVRRDFRSGVRAGAVGTPAAFVRDEGGGFTPIEREALLALGGG